MIRALSIGGTMLLIAFLMSSAFAFALPNGSSATAASLSAEINPDDYVYRIKNSILVVWRRPLPSEGYRERSTRIISYDAAKLANVPASFLFVASDDKRGDSDAPDDANDRDPAPKPSWMLLFGVLLVAAVGILRRRLRPTHK